MIGAHAPTGGSALRLRLSCEVMLQVARSSANSVAFGIGMFAGQGTLGEGKQRAFSVRFVSCICYNVAT